MFSNLTRTQFETHYVGSVTQYVCQITITIFQCTELPAVTKNTVAFTLESKDQNLLIDFKISSENGNNV